MTDQDLHVVFGETAAGAWMQALGPCAHVVVQRDILSSGPVPPLDDWPDWLEARRRHWRRLTGGEGPFLAKAEVDLYLQVEALRDSARVVLWCGRGLEEQLLKAFLPSFMARHSVELGKLYVIQLPVVAAGYLGPDGLLDHPAPAALAQEEVEALRRAWDAFTQPDPRALATLVRSDRASGQALPAAMAPLLRRFPDKTMGLTYWEHEILKACQVAESRSLGEILVDLLDKAGQDLDFLHEIVARGMIACMLDRESGAPLLEPASGTVLTHQSRLRLSELATKILSGHDSYWPHRNGDARCVGGAAIAGPEGVWCAIEGYTDVVLHQTT